MRSVFHNVNLFLTTQHLLTLKLWQSRRLKPSSRNSGIILPLSKNLQFVIMY